MSDSKIEPQKITKPIQLLAAWLAGLVLINGAFLTAATLVYNPTWAAGVLVIASVINVPLFLISIFVLQTKFRPEMQEDEFYHKYLESRYSALTRKSEVVEKSDSGAGSLVQKAQMLTLSRPAPRNRPIQLPTIALAQSEEDYSVRINDLLPFFSALVSDLQIAGIKLSGTFGSTSEPPLVPKHIVISVGEGFPFALTQEILSITQKYKVEGITFTPSEQGSIHSNKLYIGAYDYDNPTSKYLRLNSGVLKKLTAPETTQKDFEAMIPVRNEFSAAKNQG